MLLIHWCRVEGLIRVIIKNIQHVLRFVLDSFRKTFLFSPRTYLLYMGRLHLNLSIESFHLNPRLFSARFNHQIRSRLDCFDMLIPMVVLREVAVPWSCTLKYHVIAISTYRGTMILRKMLLTKAFQLVSDKGKGDSMQTIKKPVTGHKNNILIKAIAL